MVSQARFLLFFREVDDAVIGSSTESRQYLRDRCLSAIAVAVGPRSSCCRRLAVIHV